MAKREILGRLEKTVEIYFEHIKYKITHKVILIPPLLFKKFVR